MTMMTTTRATTRLTTITITPTWKNYVLLLLMLLFSCMHVHVSEALDPNLPFGDINVVIVTDIHSFVAGHERQEPFWNMDYGDVLSFWELLKRYVDHNGKEMDLWFVNNGDWVHGTGLSANGDPSSLVPILQKMPFDAVNCGNHELYEESIVEYMIRPGGFVDWWGNRYLTANVMKANTNDDTDSGEMVPLGKRYKVLHGKYSDLLVFGFLYNLKNPCDLIHVREVQAVIQEQWFTNVLKNEQYDAILVLAHMDVADPLVDIILNKIREVAGENMPVQFVTGHTHYRGLKQVDAVSSSAEAGRFLDTIGFVSFPTIDTVDRVGKENATELFKTAFLDADKSTIHDTLGLGINDFYTQNGKDLSAFIAKTRNKLGLTEEIGCAPQDYVVNTTLHSSNSIWKLYRDEVIPKMFFSRENTDEISNIMLLSKESWRYDLFSKSTLVVDDIWAVAPFNDTVTFMGAFPGSVIQQLNTSINAKNDMWLEILPNFIMIGDVDVNDAGSPDKLYGLYTHEYHAHIIKDALLQIDPELDILQENTNYSSTILWLSFVMENWACNGLLGQLPDWFPKPDRFGTKVLGGGENVDEDKIGLAAIFMVLILLLVFVFCCCRHLMRCICYRHEPVLQEELDAFSLNENDASENGMADANAKPTGIVLDEDDHEML